jgi:hypothetical protein
VKEDVPALRRSLSGEDSLLEHQVALGKMKTCSDDSESSVNYVTRLASSDAPTYNSNTIQECPNYRPSLE